MGSCPLLEVFNVRNVLCHYSYMHPRGCVLVGRVTYLQIRVAPEYQRLSILLIAMVREVCITVECRSGS